MRGGDGLPSDIGRISGTTPSALDADFWLKKKKSQEFIKQLSQQEKAKSCKVSGGAFFRVSPIRTAEAMPPLDTAGGDRGSGLGALRGQQPDLRGSERRIAWKGIWRPRQAGRAPPQVQGIRGAPPHSPSVLRFASR